MWYTNQSSSTTPDCNSSCGAIDQYGNPISIIMSLPADHSYNGRMLRTLNPKRSTYSTISTLPSCLNHGNCDPTNNNDYFPLNHRLATSSQSHHLMGVVEQGGRMGQFNGHQPVVVSSRWNPTPEQLTALEELYSRGTRTPSAIQIQHITSQLRRYGKIEGKNVFYWFQNHKARERQKRRRHQLEDSSSPNDKQQSRDHHDHHTKEPAPGDESDHNDKGTITGFEIEQTKLWAAPTNCSALADQESVHKPEKTAAECVADDERVQFHDHHNSLQIASATTFQDRIEEHGRRRTSLSLLAKNTTWDDTHYSRTNPSCIKPTTMVNEACEYQDNQGNNHEGALTLELFPLRSNGAMDLTKDDQGDDDYEERGTHLTSYQFIEFLPLKNSTAYSY